MLLGAQLAVHLGLPYASAPHFTPGDMMEAIQNYRERFRPSPHLQRPDVMPGLNVIAAETDEEAKLMVAGSIWDHQKRKRSFEIASLAASSA